MKAGSRIALIAAILGLAGAPAAQASLEACLKNHYILLKDECTQDWLAVNDGLYQRDVLVVTVDPTRNTTVYAGVMDGLFKSTDAGASWSSRLFIRPLIAADFPHFPLSPSFVSRTGVTHIAIDATDPARLHVGTGWRGGFAGGNELRRYFRSVDGGASWINSKGSSMHDIEHVHSLAPAPSDQGTIYVATYDYVGDTGLFAKSTDRGATWKYGDVYGISPLFQTLAVDPLDPRTLYGGAFWFETYLRVADSSWVQGGPRGVLKSRDGGDTWSPTGLASDGVTALAVDSRDSRTVYAGTYGRLGGTSLGFQGLWKSVDGGASWSTISNGLRQFIGRQSSVATIALDSDDSNTIYLVMLPDGGVFRSFDAGATWSPFNDGLRGQVRSVTLVAGEPNTLYAATAEGVFKVTDILPALFLDAPRLCVGSPWSVTLSRSLPDAPTYLYGTSDGDPWGADWFRTDATGRTSESGVFGSEGVHTLRVRVDGVLSNSITFEIARCPG